MPHLPSNPKEEPWEVSWTELFFLLEVLQEKVNAGDTLLPEEYEIWNEHKGNLVQIKKLMEEELEKQAKYTKETGKELPEIEAKPGVYGEEPPLATIEEIQE